MSNEMMTTNESFSFAPKNLDEAMKYAKLISESDLAPKDFKGKPGNVLVAIQMGMELGLKPMQSIQNIAVINGRPSVWGDAMLAIIQSHPDFEWIKETHSDNEANCFIKRRGQEPHHVVFTMEDAKKANLLGKQGPWSQYPKRMLQMRARSFCCRNTFADALRGIHCAEESQDLPREVYEVKEKSNTKLLNESLMTNEIDYKLIFSKCNTLDELKESFDEHKTKETDDLYKQKMIYFKDQRKAELQKNLEVIDVNVEPESKEIQDQTTDEWKKDYDNTTGEVK